MESWKCGGPLVRVGELVERDAPRIGRIVESREISKPYVIAGNEIPFCARFRARDRLNQRAVMSLRTRRISILNHALRGCSYSPFSAKRSAPLAFASTSSSEPLPLSFHPFPLARFHPSIPLGLSFSTVRRFCNSFIIERVRKIDRRFSMFIIILNDARCSTLVARRNADGYSSEIRTRVLVYAFSTSQPMHPPPFPPCPFPSSPSSLRPRLFRSPNLPVPVPRSAVTGLSADRSPSNRARQHHQSTSDDFSMAARSSPLLAFRSCASSSISWRSPALARRDATRGRATDNFFQLSSRDRGF